MGSTSSSKASRTALALASLALLVTCRSAGAGTSALPAPAGILLFLADDHGRDYAGVYGHPSVRTPALDALARAGLRFTGVRAVTAICQPSRAALLTGLHPESNGVFGFYPLKEGVVPLSARLADAGYFCGLVGKRHIDPFERYRFDYAPPMTPEEGRDNARFLADVQGFFDARATRAPAAPFFLLVAFHDAHRPFPIVAGTGLEAAVPDPADPARVPLPVYLPDLAEVRAEVAGYLDAVERLDRGVAALLLELERRDLADDTLVLYTSDHGEPFPFAKSTLYEAGLAVPLLVRWPGRVRAGTSAALVSLVDVAPTLLELAHVPAPDLEGQSFAGLLLGRTSTHRARLFATQTDHLRLPSRPIRSVRTERFHYLLNFATEQPLTIESVTTCAWSAMLEAAPNDPKLAAAVEHFLQRPTEELYDLAADPHELADRAADPALARELTDLRALLLDDMRALADPLLFVTPFATDEDRAHSREAYWRWQELQRLRFEYSERDAATEKHSAAGSRRALDRRGETPQRRAQGARSREEENKESSGALRGSG